VIAPHAGYDFSGPVAGSAFRPLEADDTRSNRTGRRVVLLGPSHRVPFRGLATPGTDLYATPLGRVPVDRELVAAVEELPFVAPLPRAHAPEHSLEVELPFLQELFGDFTLLPLVVGDARPDEVAAALEAVWGDEDTVVVVSSDLSHFLSYDEARQVDGATAEQIVALRGPLASRQACGAFPINGLLVEAARRGLRAELLDLRSSGDTAGDRSRVVGYGAFVFTPL
jgi:AmmeMemoRadiSam system protein B